MQQQYFIILSLYCFMIYCLPLPGKIYYENVSLSEMPDEADNPTSAKDTGIVLALVLVPIIVLFTILGVALAFAEYCNAGVSFCLRCRCFRRSVNNKQKRSRSDPPRFSTSMKSSSGGTDLDLDMYQRAVEAHQHV